MKPHKDPTPVAAAPPASSTAAAGRSPEWFQRAVAAPYEDRYVEVESCRIHYQRWGAPGRAGLMFVHGGFAHSHWWDFIAPFFSEQYCVTAIDLSGMGDSGYRNKYSGELFAKEVLEVCAHAGFAPFPIIVGHSFGGYVALEAAALHGRSLKAVVVVDFPIRPPEVQHEHQANRPLVKTKEVYPRHQAALDRFRLIPPQPCDNSYILEHIARHSLAKVKGGWSWKFDDRIFKDFDLGNILGSLEKVACPLAVIYGAKSALFPPEIVAYMSRVLANRIPMLVMPEAHHHLFLEQPLMFVEKLRKLLQEWEAK